MVTRKTKMLLSLATIFSGLRLTKAYINNRNSHRSLKSRFIENQVLPIINTKEKLANPKVFADSFNPDRLQPTKQRLPRRWQRRFQIQAMTGYSLKTYHVQADSDHRAETIILYLYGSVEGIEMPYLHWQFLSRLANYTTASIYVPEIPSPLAHSVDTIYQALENYYRDLLEAYDAKQIVVLGASLGASIALGFNDYLYREKLPLPLHTALISPILSTKIGNYVSSHADQHDVVLAPYGLEKLMARLAGNRDLDDPLVNPIATDFSHQSSLSLYVGGNELLLDSCRQFLARANRVQHRIFYQEFPEMFHLFQLYDLTESYQLFDYIARFLYSDSQMHNNNKKTQSS
ncbi:alpha/beta hydrolase fold domain-containing protein [Aerococcus kribbianus]|uniref:Alpha/beta hydrolase fold domain-containing protein n=1 Tax=Aerococcus kribbianus TaxID=2999064 RepID=A0A9X3JFY1_9LACT|nr:MULTISPECIES: alpha/beta hydrolase fold domain-containing protein [unclassified Aerococcus]MCZ0717532.1 alpha/beta hydrolase fold domain-containing protein [Aerococcus sp. YH-aer221]MCZ0725820.1 alpha/beta hydrolase fold domain-containing protein [Aerococcus sp. YH-aer222]